MTDQPTLPEGRPALSPQPSGAAGTRPPQAQTTNAGGPPPNPQTPNAGGPPPMQFAPHEPNTGSPASSAAKTSGVLGAPLFGVLALAAVGIAGGGVGAGLSSLPGIPGLEGTSVRHAGPELVRGAPTEQIGSNAAFTAPALSSGSARPGPAGLGLVLPPGAVAGGPITASGAPAARNSAPPQRSPERAGPQAGGQPKQPRSG